MTSHSNSQKKDTTRIQQLAMSVYLNVYRQLIEVVKPSMGLATIDLITMRDVVNRLASGDIVVDISDAVDNNLPRATIRSYISSASNSERIEVLRQLVSIIEDPLTPAYFRGFRKDLMTYVVGVVGRKRWHMGDVENQPFIKVDELGNNIVLAKPRITIRLRDN